ncbi:MAG: SPOR domain-containing protein [Pseudomonadota bacterium]
MHLASFADPAALSVAWRSLLASESGALSKLSPFARAVTSSSGDVLYRLVAGPFSSETEARRVCQHLKSNNRFCKISTKLGTPLAQTLATN